MAGLVLACGLFACGAETDAPEPYREPEPRHASERRGEATAPPGPQEAGSRGDMAVEGEVAVAEGEVPVEDETAEEEGSVSDSPRFVASLGKLHIQGPMDKAMVRRLFGRKRASLARCARKAAQAGEDPTGSIDLQLVLTDSHPEVKAVVVKSNGTGSGKRLTRCVDRVLRSWSWPTQYVCGAAQMRLRIDVRRVQGHAQGN